MVFLLLGGPDQYLDEPPPGEEEKAFVLKHSTLHPTLLIHPPISAPNPPYT